MTKEELAVRLEDLHLLRGNSMRIPKALVDEATANGLVIIFGESDDNLGFRGAIHDEVGAYRGVNALLYFANNHWEAIDEDTIAEQLSDHDAIVAAHDSAAKKRIVQAFWCKEPTETVWYIDTLLPHARFNIYTSNHPGQETNFCKALVIDLHDLRRGVVDIAPTAEGRLAKALDAFWAVVAEQHPHVRTGDMGPGEDEEFNEAADTVVQTWLRNNSPQLPA